MRLLLSIALVVFIASVQKVCADQRWWTLARGTDFNIYDKCVTTDGISPAPTRTQWGLACPLSSKTRKVKSMSPSISKRRPCLFAGSGPRQPATRRRNQIITRMHHPTLADRIERLALIDRLAAWPTHSYSDAEGGSVVRKKSPRGILRGGGRRSGARRRRAGLGRRRPKTRRASTAGIKRLRTASCSSTTACPAISNGRSRP